MHATYCYYLSMWKSWRGGMGDSPAPCILGGWHMELGWVLMGSTVASTRYLELP